MSSDRNIETIKTGWEQLGKGEMDALVEAYAENMIFVLPGQSDVLRGRDNFRAALDNIGSALPPGFDITNISYFTGENEIVNVVSWKSTKIEDGTQSAILWKFDDHGKIIEERWFVDTEQWKQAF